MAEDKGVHSGHRQRMRERAIKDGFASFNPHQVMEVLLFYAIPLKDVSEIAHALINRFGSVRSVLNAPREELVQISGVGERVADWLLSLGELVESYGALSYRERPRIENCRTAFEFLNKNRKAGPSAWQMCMTPAGLVQMYTQMCDSTAWGTAPVLRKSIEEALAVHARNIIVAVFVTDPIPQVEDEDREFAEQYGYVLSMMDAELLDVILIGTEQTLSLQRIGVYDRTKFGRAKSLLSERYLHEESWPIDCGDELPEWDDGL